MPLPQSFLLCACEKDGVTWRPEGPERMPVHAHACDYTLSGQGWGEVRRTDHILSQERVGEGRVVALHPTPPPQTHTKGWLPTSPCSQVLACWASLKGLLPTEEFPCCQGVVGRKGASGVEEEFNFLFPLTSTPHSSPKPP